MQKVKIMLGALLQVPIWTLGHLRMVIRYGSAPGQNDQNGN